MRWLINYIRSCFCNHEWELLEKINIYDYNHTGERVDVGTRWIYRCEKCGYVNKVNS